MGMTKCMIVASAICQAGTSGPVAANPRYQSRIQRLTLFDTVPRLPELASVDRGIARHHGTTRGVNRLPR